MPDLRLVQVVYKRTHYRTKLEAQWAVFFDHLKIEYAYQQRDHEVSDGSKYRPDFWLPTFGCFFDARPNHRVPADELRKLALFAVEDDHPLLLTIGLPGKERMYLLDRTTFEGWNLFAATAEQANLASAFFENLSDYASVTFGELPRTRGLHLLFREQVPNTASSLNEAAKAAREAKF